MPKGRTPIYGDAETKQLSINIPKEWVENLKTVASKNGSKYPDFLRSMVIKTLNENGFNIVDWQEEQRKKTIEEGRKAAREIAEGEDATPERLAKIQAMRRVQTSQG